VSLRAKASRGGGSELLNFGEGMGEAKEMKSLVKLKGQQHHTLQLAVSCKIAEVESCIGSKVVLV
jgi:hypothetical protein